MRTRPEAALAIWRNMLLCTNIDMSAEESAWENCCDFYVEIRT